jgi:hypothetical protein
LRPYFELVFVQAEGRWIVAEDIGISRAKCDRNLIRRSEDVICSCRDGILARACRGGAGPALTVNAIGYVRNTDGRVAVQNVWRVICPIGLRNVIVGGGRVGRELVEVGKFATGGVAKAFVRGFCRGRPV